MSEHIRVGVIGGSGVYDLPGLTDVREIDVDTPFGPPSDSYIIGTIQGQQVAFLARHRRGHTINPTHLNYRANIWGFKQLGVEYLISMNACGSLQEEIEPGHIVIPDQLYDRTRLRPLTFFDDPGLVVHPSVADPLCTSLSTILYEAVLATGKTVHKGGDMVVIEGPRFSTRVESRIFRRNGFAVIGMTAVPEAFLAREAQMSYAIIAHVTDYDVWREEEVPVTVEMVIKTLLENAAAAQQATLNAIAMLQDAPLSPYANALQDAIITNRTLIPTFLKEKYALLIGDYLD
jgi:5'-methylthioadenosine phosphorylase